MENINVGDNVYEVRKKDAITVTEAAAILGVSRQRVHVLIKDYEETEKLSYELRKGLQSFKDHTNRYFTSEDWLNDYLARRGDIREAMKPYKNKESLQG